MYLTPAQIKGRIKNCCKTKWIGSYNFVTYLYDGAFS